MFSDTSKRTSSDTSKRTSSSTSSAKRLLAALVVFAALGLANAALGLANAALGLANAAAHADTAGSVAASATAKKRAVRGSDPNRVVINFMGDLSYPAGWGGWDYVEKQKNLLYRQVQRILDGADLNFVNIECPISEHPTVAKKRYPIRCKPHQIPYFVDAGFNFFSLANNHSVDVGGVGMTDTIKHLREADSAARPLWWAGVGENSAEAASPARFEVPGTHIVVALFAVANTSGRGRVGGLHDKTLEARIAEAAKHADIVIVSSHHGPEYYHAPRPWTVKRYHQLIDAGATLVVGHHPHVVQGFERYKRGAIFYSQGNFSFASRTRRHLATGARMYSVMSRVVFQRGPDGNVAMSQIEFIPLYASNKSKWTLDGKTIVPRHAEPQLLSGAFARFALDEFEDFSRQVPGSKKTATRFRRVGARMFMDLGQNNPPGSTAAGTKRLLARQAREYQAVIDAGVAPTPATESEMRVKQRAGTPWPPPSPESIARKRAKKKKAQRKRKRAQRNRRKRAGKRRSNRRRRR